VTPVKFGLYICNFYIWIHSLLVKNKSSKISHQYWGFYGQILWRFWGLYLNTLSFFCCDWENKFLQFLINKLRHCSSFCRFQSPSKTWNSSKLDWNRKDIFFFRFMLVQNVYAYTYTQVRNVSLSLGIENRRVSHTWKPLFYDNRGFSWQELL